MLRQTRTVRNVFTTHARGVDPLTHINSNHRGFGDPQTMTKMKKMYFTLGLDQQPLRRSAVIQADGYRFLGSSKNHGGSVEQHDSTGYGRSKVRQVAQWHRRVQYQEFHLRHATVRQVWRMLRKYPAGGAKIDGASPTPYFGYDGAPVNRFTMTPLPAQALELYPRRRLLGTAAAAAASASASGVRSVSGGATAAAGGGSGATSHRRGAA